MAEVNKSLSLISTPPIPALLTCTICTN